MLERIAGAQRSVTVKILFIAFLVLFAWAYGLSALARSTPISAYSAGVLKARRRAWIMFMVLCALYVFLYILLKSEDYALLMSAGGLFFILAAVMFITRDIDWYALGGATDANAPAGEQAPA